MKFCRGVTGWLLLTSCGHYMYLCILVHTIFHTATLVRNSSFSPYSSSHQSVSTGIFCGILCLVDEMFLFESALLSTLSCQHLLLHQAVFLSITPVRGSSWQL